MSRIGKMPIEIPGGVTVEVDGDDIRVAGPKGELSRTLPGIVSVSIEDTTITVTRPDDSRPSRSHQGLVRSLVANMVQGVHTGFERSLEINGVGYRAELLKGYIRFDLGYSHPIFFELPAGIEAEVKTTEVTLRSSSKELVGQVAAKIRGLRPPEPYKGKGVKYKEEVLRRKAGKTGK